MEDVKFREEWGIENQASERPVSVLIGNRTGNKKKGKRK
jgi:hypothetical protein